MDDAHCGTMPSSTRRNCKTERCERFGLLLLGMTGLVHTSELDVDHTVSPDSFTASILNMHLHLKSMAHECLLGQAVRLM